MNLANRVSRRLGVEPLAVIGLVVLLGGLLVWGSAFTGGLSALFRPSERTITAQFPTIEDIVPNDPVRIDGVQIGSVLNTTGLADGRGASVKIALNGDAGQVYANASAQILWRTVLGANDAIALNPGTPDAGPLGSATIPMSHDSSQVELDEITRVLTAGAQSGIRTSLQQLAPAFSDHPALASSLTTLARVAPEVKVGVGAVRGQVQDSDLESLVQQSSLAVQALDVGTAASSTRNLVQSAATTLTALSVNQGSLRSTIADAGNVLPGLTVTANKVNGVLNRLDPLVAKLTPEVPQVAPALVALHPAVVQADSLLHSARPLLDTLRPTVNSLAASAQVGVPVINSLSPSLVRLSKTIFPGLDESGPEEAGHPGYDMIGPIAVGLGGLASFFDQNGHQANLTLGVEDAQSEQLLPCTEDFGGADLVTCESISAALGTVFTGGTGVVKSLEAEHRTGVLGQAVSTIARVDNTAMDKFNAAKLALTNLNPKLSKLAYSAVSGVITK